MVSLGDIVGGGMINTRIKFVIGAIVIVAALAWLGFVGFQESKAYYITVDEYRNLGTEIMGKKLKVAGDVVSGSIDRSKPQTEFVISNKGSQLKVRYVGSIALPDTFMDGSKAVVEGSVTQEGIFQASRIEAKCASKYEAVYEQKSAL
jgi:cytochrome c-type biogenesis protein CcmE